MGQVFEDNSLSIGRTPLVQLNRVADGAPATILGKVEGRQSLLLGQMPHRRFDDLGRRAKRRSGAGSELIEPTSGNTGIALAFVSAARGYRLTLTMPETMSIERRRVLKMLGANLELTPGDEGMQGAIERAEQLVAAEPGRYVMLHQFKNPANPAIHFRTTGPEIWEDTDGGIDVLVAGIGTGGTITGVSRYIKNEQGKQIVSVGVEPALRPGDLPKNWRETVCGPDITT